MRIQTKLFLTIVVSSILFTVAMVLLVQWSLDRELLAYANQKQIAAHQPLAEELALRYEDDQWQALKQSPYLFHELSRQYGAGDYLDGKKGRKGKDRDRDRGSGKGSGKDRDKGKDKRKGKKRGDRPKGDGPMGDGPGRSGRRPPPPHDRPGSGPNPPRDKDLTLLDTNYQLVAGYGRDFDRDASLPIRSDGEVVGHLVLPRIRGLTDDFDLDLRDQQSTALGFAGLIVVVVSALVAFLISPTIVRPIRQIAAATDQITHGQYDTNLGESRRDELGELARDVNELGRTLKDSEIARQRWLADTSHELRTPLAIIKGEIEAMLDGIRALDLAQLNSLKQEVDHLQKLVDDLTDLSNADIGSLRYNKQWLSMNALIEARIPQIEARCAAASLSLIFSPHGSDVEIYGDEQRLNQLLDNLINNSCKYTDPGGQVVIELTANKLIVEDSAPGVPDDALNHIFDHLYRVESSRNRQTGGSGLGLAIVSRIVAGHNAEITALHSALGGIRIEILLPEGESA